MIAVSSRALQRRASTVAALCDEAHARGFRALGISDEPSVRGAGVFSAPSGSPRVKVVSLRAGCLERVAGRRADAKALGSADAGRAAAAVELALEHATLAANVQCGLLVLDGGHVEGAGLDERFRSAEGLVERGEPCGELLEEVRRLAAPRRSGHLERLCRAVHGIARSRPGLALALLPASRPDGLLTLGALQDVLAELRGLEVGVWVDVGHAKARERLGGEPLAVVLPAVAARVVGIDAHDCQRLQEHLTPGDGEVDWKLVAANLPRRAVCVLDVEASDAKALGAAARAAAQMLGRGRSG